MSEFQMNKTLVVLALAVVTVTGCHKQHPVQPPVINPPVVENPEQKVLSGTVSFTMYRQAVHTEDRYSPEFTSVVLNMADGSTERVTFPSQGDLRGRFPVGSFVAIEYTGSIVSAKLVGIHFGTK